MDAAPTLELLLTGDELMSGDTVDSNSARIAQALGGHSLLISRKTTLGDDRPALKAALSEACKRAKVVIMNGGLGPTQDDLTAAVVADVAGVALTENKRARDHVLAWCERRGIAPNSANLKQALLPEGADIIDNPRGSAVGFALLIGECWVLTTPGVPSELGAMMPEVTTRCVATLGGATRHTQRIQTFGIGESSVEMLVREQLPDWPPQVQLGFRAGMPQLELKLHIDDPQHLTERDATYARLETLMGDHILGPDETTLAGAVQQALRQKRRRMTTAESCTGGLIASMITAEPGSSAVFDAGFVTYSNHAKRDILGVDDDTLKTHGAVSEPVVQAMLTGALAASGADIGVAVSGIAGPDGGTPDKPVGTVWIAWGTREENHTKRLQIPGDRALFQKLVAALGLDLVRRQLLGLPKFPDYIRRQAV